MGFYKHATHRRPGDEPFWDPPFMTRDGPKMVYFGPKMAKQGRIVNVPKWSKSIKMANLSIFDHSEPLLAHLDTFGP